MRFLLLLVFTFPFCVYGQRTDFDGLNFKKADSIAKVYKGESIINLPVLTHNLTTDLTTDVEKFRAIYTWVSTNIENDYNSYLRTVKKRKKLADNREAYLAWNNGFTPKVFENLVKYRKTSCTGYAYLLREMANLADIKCEIVNGYGRTPTIALEKNSIPNHSWNAVELNGKWYLCDPTWSAGLIILEDNVPKFRGEYCDGYFLAEPALFAKNHYPLEPSWSLLPNPLTFDAFLEGPVVYKEAFSPNVIPIFPNKMSFEALMGESVFFKLSIPDNAMDNTISLLLVKGNKNKVVRPKIIWSQTKCSLEYNFERLGKYDVHLQRNDTIMATYVVNVVRKKKI